LITLTTMTTPLLCIARNSWITVWITLEINTLAFCGILRIPHKKSNKIIECRIKYFIIQSIASGIFIIMSIQTKNLYNLIIIQNIIVISLIIKMAASPFQEWFVNIRKYIKKYQLTLLITWQKLAPIFLILFQVKNMILLFIILSILIGRLLQLNKANLIEIMRYSSVFNLGWILTAIIIDTKIFLWFSIVYWLSVVIIMHILKNYKINTLNTESKTNTKKWVLLIVLANLAGIPPLSGFLVKWILILTMVKTSIIVMSITTLTISAMNFFIYLRIIRKQILLNSNKTQIENKIINKTINKIMLMINITPIILLIRLGHAWNKGL